ncbi:toll/interleukin-1 receptor domain-containing protein [Saccharothrix saharensis]|uniref:toll/interleukin-1 receptor domain-containing protein n=1 Tax=Saccharothrix saharensis TaxID=571190 RepID=UPI00368E0E13
MKVFLSWSGAETRQFAGFLHEWLQLVIQTVKPWMSDKDIAKGRLSMAELGAELEGTRFGIVVLTAANQASQWINFEAGAISRSVGQASVVPLLLDLKKTDVVGPLSQFQAVDATDRGDVAQLLAAINAQLPEPLPETRLTRFLDREWNAFRDEVAAFRASGPDTAQVRTDRDILDEILESVREIRERTPRRPSPPPAVRPQPHTLAGDEQLAALRRKLSEPS